MARSARKPVQEIIPEEVEEVVAATEDDHLNAMSIPQLTALIDKVVGIRDSKIRAARQKVIDEVKAKLAEYDLTPEDLAPKEKGERKTAGIKYRSPEGSTWAGRGKLPAWLIKLEAEGHNRNEFLTEKPGR